MRSSSAPRSSWRSSTEALDSDLDAPYLRPIGVFPLQPARRIHILRARVARVADRGEAPVTELDLLPSYRPSDDEPFMNPSQREYFRRRLQIWREELFHESSRTRRHLRLNSFAAPDIADRASAESDCSLELRSRDRERKLIGKIDAALRRLEEGDYGYCEETGEPISLRRLEARPIATLGIDAQERHERREKAYRGD